MDTKIKQTLWSFASGWELIDFIDAWKSGSSNLPGEPHEALDLAAQIKEQEANGRLNVAIVEEWQGSEINPKPYRITLYELDQDQDSLVKLDALTWKKD